MFRRQKYFIVVIFCILSSVIIGQNDKTPPVKNGYGQITGKKFIRSDDVFGCRVFIENKGQFKPLLGKEVLYAIDNGLEKIFFTREGLIYELRKVYELTEREREKIEHKGKNTHPPDKLYYVSMSWLNTTPGASVVPSETQSHYMTYGTAELNSHTFKKITYKNVYRNIDVEYSIPADIKTGIKYSFILHPGADPKDIQFEYTGDVNRIKNDGGNIIVTTPLEDIIEHTPKSFYENSEPVESSFTLTKGKISFILPSGLHSDRTLIIDPWVSTTPSLTTNSYAYDIDYDFLGNTFVYGGYNPFKVACYDVTGVLTWVFAGSIPAISWSSAPFTGQASNFGINKFNSKAYIGQGYVGGGNKIVRLDASGNYDNFANAANSSFQEVWDMGFHCVSTEVFVLGGGTSSNITAATMNTLSAALTLSAFQPTISSAFQDIVSHAIDDQANIFVIYAGNSAVANKISLVNSTFNGNLWTQPSGYSSFSEQGNKSVFQTGMASNGFNALAANNNYLFYYDGKNIAAINKTTGAVITSTTLSAHTLKAQGGIAVDDCDVLYLGGNGSVVTYSYSGSAFTALAPISLSVSTSSQFVYDIKLDKTTQMLYVSGSGFAGVYLPVPSLACPTGSSICIFNQGGISVSSTNITCASLGSATAAAIGTGPFTYTWLPSMQTGSVATGLSPGSHAIIVKNLSNNNTYTAVAYVSPVTPLTGSVPNPLTLNCFGMTSGTAAVNNLSGGSGNQSYLWTNGTTTQTTAIASGLGIGNYTVSVVDALTSCAITQTFALIQPPALTISAVQSATIACVNTSITVVPVVSGGTPAYTYSWSNGTQSAVTQVTESQGGNYVYTVVATDSKNCAISYTVPVTYMPGPVISVANSSICPGQTGVLTASGAQTYSWSTSANVNSITASPPSTTVYTVTGTGALCSTSLTGTITVMALPVPTLSSNSPVCSGQTLQLNAGGGSSYQWSGPNAFSSSQQNPLLIPSTLAQNGTYQLKVTAANSCTAGATLTVVVNPTPPLSAVGSTVCQTQTVNLSSSTSFTGCTYLWSGPNGYNSSLANPTISPPGVNHSGVYTVTITDPNGCKNVATAQVTVSAMPTSSFTTNSPQCEASVLLLNGSSAVGASQYSWVGPNGFTSSFMSTQIFNVSPLASGIYSLTITHGPCVNVYGASVTVNSLPTLTVQSNQPVCETASLSISVLASNAVTNYHWQIPGGTTSASQNIVRTSANLSDIGVYTVTVYDGNLCSNSRTLSVMVYTNPIISVNNVQVCLHDPAKLTASGAASYIWYGPLFQASGTEVIVASANNLSPITYTVVGTAGNSCVNSKTMALSTMSLPVPTLNISPGTEICLNDEIVFTAKGGLKYQWYGPSDLYYEGSTVIFNASNKAAGGSYTLTAIDSNACRGWLDTIINVHPLPNGSLFGLRSGCAPLCSQYSFSVSATSSVSAVWKINEHTIKGNTFNYCFESAGQQFIKASIVDLLHSCKNTLEFEINVFPNPVANFVHEPEVPIENEQVIFTNNSQGDELTKFNWYFTDNSAYKSTLKNVSYIYSTEGLYPVVLVTSNTWGCMDTIIKTIQVDPDFGIYVPNIFTPNNDNTNDIFIPVIRAATQYELKVFDRWGHLLFRTTDFAQGWDGIYKGTLCKNDVYIWKIDVTSKNGGAKHLNGHVTLSK